MNCAQSGRSVVHDDWIHHAHCAHDDTLTIPLAERSQDNGKPRAL